MALSCLLFLVICPVETARLQSVVAWLADHKCQSKVYEYAQWSSKFSSGLDYSPHKVERSA